MALALNDRLFVMDGSEVIGQPIKVQMSQAEKNRAARDQKQMYYFSLCIGNNDKPVFKLRRRT